MVNVAGIKLNLILYTQQCYKYSNEKYFNLYSGDCVTVSGGIVVADGSVVETNSNVGAVQDNKNAASEIQSLQQITRVLRITTRDITVSSLDTALGDGVLTADTAVQNADNEGSTSGRPAEREISSEQVAPGGEIKVTVNAEAQNDTLAVAEEFSPNVEEASIESITVNGDPALPIANAADSTGATVALDGLNPGDNVVMEYSIGVAKDQEVGTNYSIAGTVTSNDGQTSLKTDKIVVKKYSIERELNSTQVAPGGELTVTVQTEAQADTISINEEFTPAVNETSIESVTVGENPVTPVAEATNSINLTVMINELDPSDSIVVEYNLNISKNVEIETNYSIIGTIADSNTETATKSTNFSIKDTSQLDGTAGEYDDDNDGDVTASELGSAVTDFGQGEVTASELGGVVTAFGQSSGTNDSGTDDESDSSSDSTGDNTSDSSDSDNTVTVEVVDIVDGDTMDIEYENGTEDTVRLIGVDTPEIHAEVSPDEYEGVSDTEPARQCLGGYGDEASTFAEQEIGGDTVQLQYDKLSDRRGSYDRLLIYVIDDGENFNHLLLDEGLARVYDSTFTESERFYDTEAAERKNQTGVWSCQNAGDRGSDSSDNNDGDGSRTSDSTLEIVEIHEDAEGEERENLNDEYVTFRNRGGDTLDLGDWVVKDSADHDYTVPSDFTLEAGEEVTLHTGKGGNTDNDLYWGLDNPVWNNSGDTVYVYNADDELIIKRPHE
jgi:micrococcal nuclease